MSNAFLVKQQNVGEFWGKQTKMVNSEYTIIGKSKLPSATKKPTSARREVTLLFSYLFSWFHTSLMLNLHQPWCMPEFLVGLWYLSDDMLETVFRLKCYNTIRASHSLEDDVRDKSFYHQRRSPYFTHHVLSCKRRLSQRRTAKNHTVSLLNGEMHWSGHWI